MTLMQRQGAFPSSSSSSSEKTFLALRKVDSMTRRKTHEVKEDITDDIQAWWVESDGFDR